MYNTFNLFSFISMLSCRIEFLLRKATVLMHRHEHKLDHTTVSQINIVSFLFIGLPVFQMWCASCLVSKDILTKGLNTSAS